LAIAATGVGGTLVAITPLALALFGTAWRPGRRVAPSVITESNQLEGAAHA
jgi:hypothetical protein